MELTRRDALLALIIGGGGTAGITWAALSWNKGDDTDTASPGEPVEGPTDTSTEAPGSGTGSTPTESGPTPVALPAGVDRLVSLAEILYPSAVTVTSEFVETYVRGLWADRQAAVLATVGQLDSRAKDEYGQSLVDLPAAKREALLRDLGVDQVGSQPGTYLPARVRYYVVNELLYALFTSPKGSSLVGIDNPVGHPGGYEDYQERPD